MELEFTPHAPFAGTEQAPAGLSLNRTPSETRRALAVGDRVEWEEGVGTTDQEENDAVSVLRCTRSREGVIVGANELGVHVEYEAGSYFHLLHHAKWGETIRLVRLSDGERF